MADRIQLRGDTEAAWALANPILADREVGLETDTKRWKIGNGLDTWNSLGYRPDTSVELAAAPEKTALAGGDDFCLLDVVTGGLRKIPFADLKRNVNPDLAENPATTTGLTWGWLAGQVRLDNVITDVAAGALTLTDNAINYVEYSVILGMTVNQSAFTSGAIPIRTVVTSAGVQTSSIDKRAWLVATSSPASYIGVPGTAGFGKGICPATPAGFTPLPSHTEPLSGNYGDYQYSDGSIMGWIPKFWYRLGHIDNPTYPAYGVNSCDIRGDFADTAEANAAGYALHRAFVDGGVEQPGFFVDKYQCANNGGIASSIKNGLPLSSNSVHNPFSGLNGTPANAYHGAIVAAKTRGADFFCSSRFIFSALAMLSLAHGQAATSTTHCEWFGGTTNFPKGCNNDALGDTNDAAVAYVSDGYLNCGKTGSGTPFARTTHNGQACGIADLNGNMWEISPGITSDGTNFYLLNPAVAMKDVTSGNTLATDLWGATGIAAQYDSLGATYGALTASSTAKYFGSTSLVLSAATSGNDWNAAGAGIPLASGGTNLFGSDGLWDYRPNEMCPIASGTWGYGGGAGVWALALSSVRGYSHNNVGFRAALYL